MSHLITLDKISLAFGLEPLLDKVNLQIANGERVCLIGRNGTGKSSLLKVIQGLIPADSGSIHRASNLKLACLDQDLPKQEKATVYEYVAEGLAEIGKLLAAYHLLIQKLAHSHTDKDLLELERLQHLIEAKQGWAFEQNIKTILDRLDLQPDLIVAELSGGWQRRAALARALVLSPDLLLLDEPTNHLDIEAIQWLEDQLISANLGLLFITHDRSLLRRLATRIIELDRGQLSSWPGDYDNFLRRKEEMLQAENKLNAEFDKKLAQEERWIRQGIKARRTRNEGRVRALESLRLERSKRREVQGKAQFNINEAAKSGQLVIEAENISQSFNNNKTMIIKNFSTRIMRGDRIGLIGPNGAGKSTLLNILLGKLNPQQGKVILGTKLQIAYFDQLRHSLQLEKTVTENVVQGSDFIEINGQRKHIMSYLGDFLFTPQRARTPVKALSGGECNRLLLARLFSQPANLLVMDEPTNDLDIETLELLEELLSQYQGTLLLVSHDRAFLDNVVTSTIVFEGQGIINEYVGGYQDWLRQRKPVPKSTVSKIEKSTSLNKTENSSNTTEKNASATIQSKKSSAANENNKSSTTNKVENLSTEKTQSETNKARRKLTYKEQKELSELPARITSLEAKQKELQEQTMSADFYQQDPKIVTASMDELKKISDELEQAYQRWDELERS